MHVRAKRRRRKTSLFLPSTPTPVNDNMRAAIIILATAPYAAAGIIDATKDSQGACYDSQTHIVRMPSR